MDFGLKQRFFEVFVGQVGHGWTLARLLTVQLVQENRILYAHAYMPRRYHSDLDYLDTPKAIT